MTVAKILKSKGSSDVATIAPEATVLEATQLLAERRYGSLVVSQDGRTVAGILSERDIVSQIGHRGSAVLAETVDKVMTRKVESCQLTDKAVTILERMTQGRFRHMPVIEAGRLAGIVTIGDVVKYRLDELAMEKDALEGMIMGF
jgi:CBS domain-containing protein